MVSRPFLALVQVVTVVVYASSIEYLVQVSCIASTGDMNTMSSPEVSLQQRVRKSLNFLVNRDHCVLFIKTTCDFKAALAILIRWESWAPRGSS